MKYIANQEMSILEALGLLAPQSSKTTLRSWIKEGRVQVDNLPVKLSNVTVAEGQTVTLTERKKFVPGGISIIYEDADIVAINKPAGLLSVATDFEKEETAHAILRNYYRARKVFVVHRLDQDTSGVMLFAFNDISCDRLKDIFEVHAIERSYTAIVEGQMTSASGTWRSFLFEDDNYLIHSTNDPSQGREAITHYKRLASNKRYSWLEVTLETGRKNQIRVHCEEAGHPVVGDKKYGAHTSPIKRLCLHAHLIAFQHPISKKKLRLESPVPQEFHKLLKPPES